MADAALLDRIKDTDKTVVTNHALERGYEEQELFETADSLDGVIYWDEDDDCYHIVTEKYVLLIRVQLGTRIVITAYPLDDTTRYHDPRFTLLRG